MAHLYSREAAVTVGKGADAVEERAWEPLRRSVCMIDTQSDVGIGTGFIAKLVTPFPVRECVVFLTNHHVLPSTEAALRCTVTFDRVAGVGHTESGRTLFDTSTWKTCQELDYSMVGLNCDVLQAIPGGVPAQVSLQRQEELHVTLAHDDMLYIIHHPGNPHHPGNHGDEAVFTKCLNGYLLHSVVGPFLTHKATTFGGSSGAPLFKVVQGEPVVVAMHCGCVPPTGPPQLNGGMLISHILHHVFTGSFKEDLPPLQKVLKESAPASAGGSPHSTHYSDSTGCHPSLTLTDLQPYALQLAKQLLPLGSVLGVPDYAMAVQLDAGSVEDKCLRVLQRWLECTPEPTWEVFYHMLRQPGLDMHNLAVKLARKHCPHVLNV